MKGVAVLCAMLAGTASAHMQMMKPYPIRSPLNKDAKGEKDYSYTNPLQASGADYPCKGYANDPFDSQATYQPGQSYEMELDGSATHDGGSCQLALTYDQGKTFKVIESMLGTCPTPKKYNFKVPSDAPTGEALLAWTWFNKVGNREMYMNCAMVTIGGSSGGNDTDSENEHTHSEHSKHLKSEDKKAAHPPMEKASRNLDHTEGKTSFDSLPDLFVANVKQKGDCVTVEGETVDFPEPGDNVIGKSDGKGYKCSGNAPFLPAGGSSDSSDKDGKKSDNKDDSKSDNKDDSKSDNKDDSKSDNKDDSKSDNKDDSKSDNKDDSKSDNKDDSKSDAKDDSKSDAKDDSEDDTNQINKTSDKKTEDKKDTKEDKTKASNKDSDKKESNKNATRSTPQSMSKIAQAFGTSAASQPRVDVNEASTNNAFSNYVGSWSCTSGEILCSPDGYTWAMCSNGAPIFMGSVAAGMTCRFGAMVAAGW